MRSHLPGIIDVIELRELQFDLNNDGRTYRSIPLSGKVLGEVIEKRCELIDTLSSFDDDLANQVIGSNSLETIDSESVRAAIRKATINRDVVPVLMGSAYKNTGVQPLMDSILSFLPSPNERSSLFDCFE